MVELVDVEAGRQAHVYNQGDCYCIRCTWWLNNMYTFFNIRDVILRGRFAESYWTLTWKDLNDEPKREFSFGAGRAYCLCAAFAPQHRTAVRCVHAPKSVRGRFHKKCIWSARRAGLCTSIDWFFRVLLTPYTVEPCSSHWNRYYICTASCFCNLHLHCICIYFRNWKLELHCFLPWQTALCCTKTAKRMMLFMFNLLPGNSTVSTSNHSKCQETY